jgi:glutathione synthase/RimK-type ligase-like ATP-grasp enzyme
LTTNVDTSISKIERKIFVMKRVGILVGRERTFPEALINLINERGKGETTAEMIKVGGVRLDMEKKYDLIVDRISHEVPFYRGFLKRCALEGTILINNPFWWSADDKFFNYSLATKLGVAVPKTVLLPQKDYIKGITSDSLRNLEFPLDWQGIIDYTGLPAILKPFDGGGWKNVTKVNSLEELWRAYDESGTLCMTLQEFVDFDQFVRCYCIGQEQVMIMPYDPRKPYLSGEQYINNPNYLTAELAARITNDVRTLNRALGYDINTVEFAIKDGTPYAIDFMNPAPDADLHSVGEFYHHWVTNAVADLVFKRLSEPASAVRYRWDAMLNPRPIEALTEAAPQVLHAVASAAEQAARTILPTPVREIPADIAAGVTEIIEEAREVVSNLTGATEEAKPKRRTRAASTDTGKTKSTGKRATKTRKDEPTTEA